MSERYYHDGYNYGGTRQGQRPVQHEQDNIRSNNSGYGNHSGNAGYDYRRSGYHSSRPEQQGRNRHQHQHQEYGTSSRGVYGHSGYNMVGPYAGDNSNNSRGQFHGRSAGDDRHSHHRVFHEESSYSRGNYRQQEQQHSHSRGQTTYQGNGYRHDQYGSSGYGQQYNEPMSRSNFYNTAGDDPSMDNYFGRHGEPGDQYGYRM